MSSLLSLLFFVAAAGAGGDFGVADLPEKLWLPGPFETRLTTSRFRQDQTSMGGGINVGTSSHLVRNQGLKAAQFFAGEEGLCGGVALGGNWVLTAAHCFTQSEVVSLRPYLAPKPTAIKTTCLHRRAGSRPLDLALAETEVPLFASSVTLDSIEEPTEGGDAFLFGWGFTETGGLPKGLQHSQAMKVVTGVACSKAHKGGIDPVTEFCAGAASSSACRRDSGGPLFQEKSPGEFVLTGISSRNERLWECSDWWDIYTKIDKTWIEDVLKNGAHFADSPDGLQKANCKNP